MCGIAGIVTADGGPPDPAILDRLAAALAHRGPDGRGRHVRGGTGLIQTRLAIIDLEGGRQPILDADGRAIVANGEIYNYRELRAEMPDVRFATASDSEPPLHLYRTMGAAFAGRLRGMYAIAIDDPILDQVVLARDPFGIKPLYLCEGPYGVAFASEAQALVAAGLAEPRLNPKALAEHLQLQFSTGTETIFAGIRRVAPGETLVIRRGKVVESRHLAALPVDGDEEADLDTLLYRLDEALMDSVGLHQRSDVPFGLFLSGGIDSATVLAMMARLNPRPVLAFTAGFPGTRAHDERERANALAAHVGARHVKVTVASNDFWTLLPRVAAAMDEPVADYACLPTYKLAETARAEVKVVLSGEGGDEVFAGYGRYRGALRPWPLAKKMRSRGIFDGTDVLRKSPAGWRDGIAAAERAETLPGRTRLQVAQATDCADWLPNDLLTKLDRCLMANGIEGRVPFLDPLLAGFAFRLPDRMKLKHGLGKWLLRQWLEHAAPAARPFDRKHGFTVPVGEWIAERPEIGELVAAQPLIAELCRPDAVRHLFRHAGPKTGPACWTLLFMALWHQRHILGRAVADDVSDMLA
jgi:asparagine synthase (glutamine-hydrolysing)